MAQANRDVTNITSPLRQVGNTCFEADRQSRKLLFALIYRHEKKSISYKSKQFNERKIERKRKQESRKKIGRTKRQERLKKKERKKRGTKKV